ncbi:J domain-containing protein, partial [Venenivibrio stagnispumantis]|nr:J domain-containing protein [Venenivibrio stagnispumantis]
IKKAFRQLALQYHPDVCKGSNCSVQFHRINEAYDIVMSSLRGPQEEEDRWNNDADETMRGMNDPSWDL